MTDECEPLWQFGTERKLNQGVHTLWQFAGPYGSLPTDEAVLKARSQRYRCQLCGCRGRPSIDIELHNFGYNGSMPFAVFVTCTNGHYSHVARLSLCGTCARPVTSKLAKIGTDGICPNGHTYHYDDL